MESIKSLALDAIRFNKRASEEESDILMLLASHKEGKEKIFGRPVKELIKRFLVRSAHWNDEVGTHIRKEFRKHLEQ